MEGRLESRKESLREGDLKRLHWRSRLGLSEQRRNDGQDQGARGPQERMDVIRPVRVACHLLQGSLYRS